MSANLILPVGPSSKAISRSFQTDVTKVDFSHEIKQDESFEKNLSDASRSQSRESIDNRNREDRAAGADRAKSGDSERGEALADDRDVDGSDDVVDHNENASNRDERDDHSSTDDNKNYSGEDRQESDEGLSEIDAEAQQSTEQGAIISAAAQQLRLLAESAVNAAASGEQATGQVSTNATQTQSALQAGQQQGNQSNIAQVLTQAQAVVEADAGDASANGGAGSYGDKNQQAAAGFVPVIGEGDVSASQQGASVGVSPGTSGYEGVSTSSEASSLDVVGAQAAAPQLAGDRSENAVNVLQKLGETKEQSTQDQANVSRVSRALQTAVNQRGGALTLRLQPPELGSLKIEMLVRDGVVNARFTAQADSVRNLLMDQMGHLRHALDKQGLVIDKLEVQLDNNSSNLGQSSDDASNDGRSKDEYAMNKRGGGQPQDQASEEDGEASTFEQVAQSVELEEAV